MLEFIDFQANFESFEDLETQSPTRITLACCMALLYDGHCQSQVNFQILSFFKDKKFKEHISENRAHLNIKR